MLQSMGSQRVKHNGATELTDMINCIAQGNYTQYLSITYNGKESKERIDVYVCITDSLCHTPESNTTL